jgi:hypothetical protein
MGRISVQLDDQLLIEAKRLATTTKSTLTAVIEDALRAALMRHRRSGRRRRARFTTFKGRGLQPGVDLDRTAGLLDRLEGR